MRARSFAAAVLISVSSVGAAEDCPITLPSDWPNASAPWQASQGWSWYGSDLLAAFLPVDGVWTGMGRAKAFRDKLWWWREGYVAARELKPNLVVAATRLDGPHTTFQTTWATNAYGEGWNAMLVGMEFPAAGCWELRGLYNDREELIVVIEVAEQEVGR